MRVSPCFVVLVLGCNSSSGHPADAAHHDSTVDTRTTDSRPIDAPAAGSDLVVTVSCMGITPAATVTTPDDNLAYVSSPEGSASNNSEIVVDQVIEFMPGPDHPVGPDPAAGMTDPGLVAPDSETTCLRFTAVGTYHYMCTVHGFTGTVTVSAGSGSGSAA